MPDPRKVDPSQPAPAPIHDTDKDGEITGADHVETFREGEVQPPPNPPPFPGRPKPHDD